MMMPSVCDSLRMVEQLITRCSRDGMTGQIQISVNMYLGGVHRTSASLEYKPLERKGLDATTGCISDSFLALQVDTTSVLSYP